MLFTCPNIFCISCKFEIRSFCSSVHRNETQNGHEAILNQPVPD
ncbi:unnamed protein product [Acanthoscelides obtectus]|uniref:Uncharacterized protein n=1 Tax=Acanthoscelides obtectus TaxID=200917 RepID=A0A9P0LT68_ACAOB|nr:unnamed protein product [Acanthoscelides obtectus]CAH2010837.1 unnamed protein product [Acanthoscelides obtectus]CAK1629999.1 hypothetical protein AOBTE_LOCUS6089 [Acanthoscelides obtectus]CAK1630021.1 hypothetical protein AOBTE_LOCUS6107 [Acanthoscelides obtectus]